MENIILLISLVVIGVAGVFAVYYLGQYLYELYVEYFTTDPDPDAPETPVQSTWEEKSATLTNSVGLLVGQLLTQIPELTEKLVRGVYDMGEKYRKVSYETFGQPDLEEKRRIKKIQEEIARRRKPLKKPTKEARWTSSEEYYRNRDDILGINRTKGRGRDEWDTRTPPISGNSVPRRFDPDRRFHAGKLPKQGKDREIALEHMYPEDDTWSTRILKKRSGSGNTGPK